MMIELCMYHDCNSEETDYCLPCKDCPHKDGCPDRCKDDECDRCNWFVRKEVK